MALPALSEVVAAPRVTIREKIRSLLDSLRQTSALSFQAFIASGSSRLEVVVSFLAMLELIKRHIVDAEQEGLFSEIELTRRGDWDEAEEGDLEFE
jgi:segregation and condensation protein A